MLAKGVSKYHKVSLLQQFNSLRYCPLTANGFGNFYKNYFFWEFDATPSPLSKTYKILMIYHLDEYSPNIYVLDKDIWTVSKSKKSIPHLYDSIKIRLCLYYPDYKEWTPTMPLCNTIIAWTYLWLYFYEEWLYTEDWKGGGIHPDSKNNELNDKDKILSPKKVIIQERKERKKNTVLDIINKLYNNRKQAYIKSIGE